MPFKAKKNATKNAKNIRSKKLNERNIIFTITCLVFFGMLSLHWAGCFNEILASDAQRYYVKNPLYGIKIPSLYQIHGIDISLHQGKINWNVLSKNLSGEPSIDFVFIKASEGRTRIDPTFKVNWEGASKAGLIKGAYHYLLPNKSGIDQAKLFLKTASFEKGDLLPVCDIEITGGASKETMLKNLGEFLTTITEETGKMPIIYSSRTFYEKYLAGKFEDYPLWIAHFHVPELEMNGSWKIWQHSDRGKLKGIQHSVDFNVFNGTQTEFNQLRF